MSEKEETTAAAPKKTVKKTIKKTARKSASAKTSPAKKVAVKRKVATKTKASGDTATPAPAVEPSIQSIIEEMNSQRKVRDKQISALIEEVREGFSVLSSSSNRQDEAHQKEMTGLYQSLQDTFRRIKDDSVENEDLNLNIFKSLSDSIKNDHVQTLKEINAQGELQDKKIEHMYKMLEQRTIRNRWIAIPGVILAVIGVVYMFYVVSIMESAMSNMSANMHLMQKDVGSMSTNISLLRNDVGNMSTNMGNMTKGITSIDNNMQQLNGNVGQIAKDLNVLTHNVVPAMKGMRNMMPWTH